MGMRLCGSRAPAALSTLLCVATFGCLSADPPPRQADIDVAAVPGVDPNLVAPASNPSNPMTGGMSGQTGQQDDGIGAAGQGGNAMMPVDPQMPTPVAGADAGEPAETLPPLTQRVFDAGDDPARNQVQAGSLCARLAVIQCAGEAYCCQSPGRDRATCERTLQRSCEDELYLESMAQAEVTGFNPAAAAAALEGLEGLAADCDTGITDFAIAPSGLASIFDGTRDSSDSCGPGLSNDPARAAASLVSCRDIANTACLPTTLLNWRCTRRGPAGSDCFTDVNCVEDHYCPNPDFDVGQTTCAARKAVGQACSLGNECLSLYCVAGSCAEATQQVAYCLAE